ncbi:LysR family transcriptional regulator [Gluconacetobacter sacchari]|uniref:LysR family transcriptional regulator n=1 Tax=Gluconacetobacter sacchari TaxID=92759 RepID=UPI0039B478E2
MEVAALVYFVSLIDAGSTTQAASDLGVGTTTLGHAVRELEQSAASALIARQIRRQRKIIVATSQGIALHRSATTLLHWFHDLINVKREEFEIVMSRSTSGWRNSQIPPGRPTLTPEQRRHILASPVSLRMIGQFLCICESGSIAGAARRLSLSQPTMTRQLARLEGALGVRLVERTMQGVILTSAARALRASCQRIDQICRRMAHDENQSYFINRRTLRLASMMPASPDSDLSFLLADLVRYWLDQRYRPALAIDNVPAPAMIDGLIGGQYDAGLTDIVHVPDYLDRTVLERIPVSFVAVDDRVSRAEWDRWSASRRIAHMMENRILGILPQGTGLRDLTNMFLDKHGIVPERTFETRSLALLLRLVMDGTCCALLPQGSFLTSETISVPAGRNLEMTFSLVWNRDLADCGNIQRLRESLQHVQGQRRARIMKIA